jgi:hypothetical protein
MKKIFFTLFVLCLCQYACAQKVIKKISKDACECLGTVNINEDSAAIGKASSNCIAFSILKYSGELKKELNIDVTDKGSLGAINDQLTADLFKCDAFIKIVTKTAGRNKPSGQSGNTSNCKDFHLGKFINVPGSGDTTKYFIFEEGMIKEYSSANEITATGKCRWIADCEYINTFIESKDPNVNMIFKKGDALNVKIINIEGNKVTFEMNFKGTYVNFSMIKVQ